MKKIILIALVLLSNITFSQTNTYHAFPDSNAQWNIHISSGCQFAFTGLQIDYSILLEGDTIIQSQAYHKLVTPTRKFVYSNGCSNPGTYYTAPEYLGSIRQDVSSKKVYIFPKNANSEALLFDFNMEVGDTLNSYLSSSTNDVVVSIDSIDVNGSFRKRWLVNPCYQIYIIEGIGSTYGLVEPFFGCATDLPSYDITCFKLNGNSIYPNLSDSCETVTDSKQTKYQNDGLEIQLENSMLYIHVKNNINRLQAFDSSGRILADVHECGTTYMLNLINYKGLLTLKILDKYGHSTIRRFIISE